MKRRCRLGIALFLLAIPLVLVTAAKDETLAEEKITYPDEWGPNLLEAGVKIVEVSSNGTFIDGTETLNDGFATEGNHWEPKWNEPPFYFIVKLSRKASVGRIRFTTQSEGTGYPKRVTIIPWLYQPWDKKSKALGKGHVVHLEKSQPQDAELDPALPPARYLRFDFDKETHDKNELEIGEVAVFEASLISHTVKAGSESKDRIEFDEKNEIYGTLLFPEKKITIIHAEEDLPLDLQLVYGLDLKEPEKTKVLLWSGEIITGTLVLDKEKIKDLKVEFYGAKPTLDFSKIKEIGFAKTPEIEEKRKQYKEQIKKKGVLELVTGDRFYIDPNSTSMHVDPVIPEKFIEEVQFQDLERIESVTQVGVSHRLLFKTKEILYANPKTDPPLTIKLLANNKKAFTFKVIPNSIKTYKAPYEPPSMPDYPFYALALRERGDLVIGQLKEDTLVRLKTPYFGELDIDPSQIVTMRSELAHPGKVEVRYPNGSVILGTIIGVIRKGKEKEKKGEKPTEKLQFDRIVALDKAKDKVPVPVDVKSLGLLERFSKKRVEKVKEDLNKGIMPAELTEVMLHFLEEHMDERLRIVLDRLEKHGVWWTFKVPERELQGRIR